MEKQQKMVVAGMGYVGLSNAALLARDSPVCTVDIRPEKVDKVNRGRSPITDPQLKSCLGEKGLMLSATTDIRVAYGDADFVITAMPTDYDAEQSYPDTSSVEAVVEAALRIQLDVCTAIRSTVPLGFTKETSSRYPDGCILFSLESLRGGRVLYDNLYLSRIILGLDTGGPIQMGKARTFVGPLKEAVLKEDVPIHYTDATEVEAAELFSDTYLTMRVVLFNKLDIYAEVYGLNTRSITEGVCLDPRIGIHYNSPSFGYGGHCPLKDTRQLLASYGGIPNRIMTAIVQADQTRKDFITGQVLSRPPKVVGIYRLTTKADSGNFRHSSILGIMRRLGKKGAKTVIYESALRAGVFLGMEIISDLEEFKQRSDATLINRHDRQLEDVRDKVYTRDLFSRD